MLCQHCDYDNTAGTEICLKCGQRIETPVPDPMEQLRGQYQDTSVIKSGVISGGKSCATPLISILVIAIVCVVWGISSCKESPSPQAPKAPIATVQPQLMPDITTGPLTEAKIRAQFPNLTIAEIALDDPMLLVIDMTGESDSETIIMRTAEDHLKICQKLFTNPTVKEVLTSAKIKTINAYGKESTENVVTIGWTRSIHKKVHYEKFTDETLPFSAVYKIASSYAIDTMVWKDFEHKDWLNDVQTRLE